MRNNIAAVCVMVVCLAMIPASLLAHHGSASYDTDKTVTVKGTVTDYIWANPHILIKLDAKDENGNIQHWVIEGQNPVSMTAIGWSRTLFKPGDQVEIDCMPSKSSNPVGFLGSSSPTAPRKRIVINGKQFQ